MAYNPPKGAGKGPGNGNPKGAPFTIDTAAQANSLSRNQTIKARATAIVASEGVSFLRAKARAWRELYPEAAAQKDRDNEIKDMIRAGTEDALLAMHEIVLDTSHKDRLAAAKAWVEHDLGRPKQAVELANKDGQVFTLNVTNDDAGVL